MFLTDLKREWNIQKVLRRLSQQRVVTVLESGNVWVIEKAIANDEKTDAALKTCYMRGWIEPLKDAVPHDELKEDGSLPTELLFKKVIPVWRLTDSGWAAINRAHEWTLIGILIGALGILFTFFN